MRAYEGRASVSGTQMRVAGCVFYRHKGVGIVTINQGQRAMHGPSRDILFILTTATAFARLP